MREILDGISNTFLLSNARPSLNVPRLPSGAFKWIPIFTCAQIYNKHYCMKHLEGWVDCQRLGTTNGGSSGVVRYLLLEPPLGAFGSNREALLLPRKPLCPCQSPLLAGQLGRQAGTNGIPIISKGLSTDRNGIN